MATSPKHIILLTIDALRADHLSCHGYYRETSPAMDHLAGEGAQFRNAFSASSHTREAVPALLTGRYPTESLDDRFTLAADSVATYLAPTEYATGAFHSNPYVSRAYGFDRDFDAFDDDLHLGQHKLVALLQRAFDKLRRRHYAPGELINQRALDWVDSVDRGEEPLFLWNHYMDVHGPYHAPDDYRELFSGGNSSMGDAQKLYKRAAVTDPEGITDDERRELIDHYDGEIRYADACIADLLVALDDRGVLENSIVLVTADHGDAFGEHGYYGHPRRLDDEVVHVPMIVSGPGVPNTTVETPTSTLDVVPTVLDIAGIETGELPGVSLLDAAEDPGRFEERRVFSSARGEGDDAHLRRFSGRTNSEKRFLEREIETGDILSVRPADGDPALEAALREHSEKRLVADRGAETDHDEETKPSEEIERRLEALGYK